MANLATMQNKAVGFPGMLEKFQVEIARALPKHLNPDRMARIALTEFRKNPKLNECDPRSVFASVIIAAQNGLEPGVMGQGSLIPFGRECQFVPGWRGLVDIANRSGRGSVFTGVIFADQKYTFTDGAKRDLVIHNETALEDPEDITHAYAIGWVKGSEVPIIELWPVEKIRKHRDRFNRVGQRHYSHQHWEMYCRKIPLLQVLKYMPASIEMQQVTELDQAADRGRQDIDLMQAATGEWVPPPADEPPVEEDRSTARAAAPPPEIPNNEPDYPFLNADNIWMDKRGQEYDETKHEWDNQANRPVVASRGPTVGCFVRIKEQPAHRQQPRRDDDEFGGLE